MPSYKLIYFNGRGRAEHVRFIFAQAGVSYEDVRVTGEEFGKMKSSLPTGMLPVLEVDGTRLTGSGPIARFLAEEFDLAGSSNVERAKIAGIIDVVDDLFVKMVAAIFGKDELKEAAWKALTEEYIPKYCGVLEKIIVANNSPDGWVFGNMVTYADLYIAVILDKLYEKEPAMANTFPNIKKCIDAAKALPKIAEWIKNRPETPF